MQVKHTVPNQIQLHVERTEIERRRKDRMEMVANKRKQFFEPNSPIQIQGTWEYLESLLKQPGLTSSKMSQILDGLRKNMHSQNFDAGYIKKSTVNDLLLMLKDADITLKLRITELFESMTAIKALPLEIENDIVKHAQVLLSCMRMKDMALINNMVYIFGNLATSTNEIKNKIIESGFFEILEQQLQFKNMIMDPEFMMLVFWMLYNVLLRNRKPNPGSYFSSVKVTVPEWFIKYCLRLSYRALLALRELPVLQQANGMNVDASSGKIRKKMFVHVLQLFRLMMTHLKAKQLDSNTELREQYTVSLDVCSIVFDSVTFNQFSSGEQLYIELLMLFSNSLTLLEKIGLPLRVLDKMTVVTETCHKMRCRVLDIYEQICLIGHMSKHYPLLNAIIENFQIFKELGKEFRYLRQGFNKCIALFLTKTESRQKLYMAGEPAQLFEDILRFMSLCLNDSKEEIVFDSLKAIQEIVDYTLAEFGDTEETKRRLENHLTDYNCLSQLIDLRLHRSPQIHEQIQTIFNLLQYEG